MPELPDVEVFKRYLDRTALHSTVEHVHILDEDVLKDTSRQSLAQCLTGHELSSSHRHGKYLFVGAHDDAWLVLHFGMTGFLEYRKDPQDTSEHTRLLLDLDGDYHLAYDCQRKFGQVSLTRDIDAFLDDHDLGPDALSLDRDGFVDALSGRGGSLKSTLMNQSAMAGIGNVYSDEIAFQARLHPGTGTGELGEDGLRALYTTARHVLETAIDKKVDIDEFPRTWLTPRREEGADCPHCDGPISKDEINGRSSYFCPSCQT